MEYKEFLNKIDDMLSRALNADETNASKSFKLLYEVQALIKQQKELING